MSSKAFDQLYKDFRAAVAKQTVAVSSESGYWTYYDYGCKENVPLICLHGTSGTAEIFFLQQLSLVPRGYRVISCQFPAYYSVDEFTRGFDRFLDIFKLQKVHLLGVSLGGYLVLHYAKRYPLRVQSLILCNSFCETSVFFQNAPCLSLFRMMPEFLLKKYILDNYPSYVADPDVAKAVDFMVLQLESISRSDLASRLTLNCTLGSVYDIEIPRKRITVIDSLDAFSLPESLRDSLYNLVHGARISNLKTGGDFPFLSRPEEFTMLLQVHLRACGTYPRMASRKSISVESTPNDVPFEEEGLELYVPTSFRSREQILADENEREEQDEKSSQDAENIRLDLERRRKIDIKRKRDAEQKRRAERQKGEEFEHDLARKEHQNRQSVIISRLIEENRSQPR
eukprot:234119_1